MSSLCGPCLLLIISQQIRLLAHHHMASLMQLSSNEGCSMCLMSLKLEFN